jgi:hypothetical protein
MNFTLKEFPDRIAELGFNAQVPSDWVLHELPPEEADFTLSTTFYPLAVMTAPHAAIAIVCAARPAHADGTLHDWAMYHLNNDGLTPRAIGPGLVAGAVAMVGESVQDSELGPMVVRFVFLEDGERLINLSLSAPELFADTVLEAWFTLLGSFTLQTPKGSRFSEQNAGPAPADQASDKADIEAPKAAPKKSKATLERAPAFADFALAVSPDSLDPDATINANLRDNGIGLVPKLIATDDAAKCATLGSGAVLAQFKVPYGWHVIDDGKRALVLHPKDEVQINLDLLAIGEPGYDGLLDELEAQVRADYPDPQCMRVAYNRIKALAVRNIAVNGEPIEQVHMLFPHASEGSVLRARITTTPEQITTACNLAEMILESCTFGPGNDQSPRGDRPDWWYAALDLEEQGSPEEAEKVIRDAMPNLAFSQIIAEMYQMRMHRMLKAGDGPGALAAFKKSNAHIFIYASQATSGGEGTALSAERDQFRKQLVAEYGSDPEADTK